MMKIFSATQIKACDQYTIDHTPVSSLSLMERAAKTASEWIADHYDTSYCIHLFCGNGNNGGDGFAMARMLYQKGFDANVFFNRDNPNFSTDALTNLRKVQEISGITLLNFDDVDSFTFPENSIIVDAVLGSGLSRILEGKVAHLINFLNGLPYKKIAIDLPSGLFADHILPHDAVVFKADETLTFQCWKKTFLHPETGVFCGNVTVLDIGLSTDFIRQEPTELFTIDEAMIREIVHPRNEFSNKGSYGKTMIVAGSFGKMGAAVLATKAALRTGSGLTFTMAPACGYEILQISCPEAMYINGGEEVLSESIPEDGAVTGIGPGLGTDSRTETALIKFLTSCKQPIVLDADALNILSRSPQNISLIPKASVITPHPKEFERLFGKTKDSFDRLELARRIASELEIFIVLKDHHTQVITPERLVFYNITGNSGMAKGGSGDVLLGIITALLAQNYTPKEAAVFGVWLHGKAGDMAAEKWSKGAMLPSDLINEIGSVFRILT